MNFDRFEHINLSCRNIHDTQKFYQTLFPDWYVRAQGEGWMHFGNDKVYLSLMAEPSETERTDKPYDSIGINHVGFVIPDGAAMQKLLDTHGIVYELYTDAPETQFRAYVHDPDGNEIELVEYKPTYALR